MVEKNCPLLISTVHMLYMLMQPGKNDFIDISKTELIIMDEAEVNLKLFF